MHKKIQNILQKYSDIKFVHKIDREIFDNFVDRLSELLDNDVQKIQELCQILEYHFIEASKFDTGVLYNPIDLLEAIIENDILGKKIDDGEWNEIFHDLDAFEKYMVWELDEKKYLEDKYDIKIVLVTDDVNLYPQGIYGRGLRLFSEKNILRELKQYLEFYPIWFIKNIKLQAVVIVESFYMKDVYGKKILLGGFETDSDNNIYLTRSNIDHAFDHELYHQAMQYYDDFEKWRKIRKKQKKKYTYKNLDKEVQGFARNYGKENVSEDQATIAEDLVSNYKYMMKRALTDRKLWLKINLVKKAFLELSDGVMNEKWWSKK